MRALKVTFHINKTVEGEPRHYLFSMKTSLRERWQIAELQAMILSRA